MPKDGQGLHYPVESRNGLNLGGEIRQVLTSGWSFCLLLRGSSSISLRIFVDRAVSTLSRFTHGRPDSTRVSKTDTFRLHHTLKINRISIKRISVKLLNITGFEPLLFLSGSTAKSLLFLYSLTPLINLPRCLSQIPCPVSNVQAPRKPS